MRAYALCSMLETKPWAAMVCARATAVFALRSNPTQPLPIIYLRRLPCTWNDIDRVVKRSDHKKNLIKKFESYSDMGVDQKKFESY